MRGWETSVRIRRRVYEGVAGYQAVARGTEMEFSRNGVPGRMQLQDDFPGGLGVQGEWSLQSGEKGPFALFFDFATGSKITLEWGPKLDRGGEWTLAESQR